MRGTKTKSWVGMLSLVAMVASLWVVMIFPIAYGDLSPSQCKQERKLVENACKPVIFGRKASAECCQRVKEVHVECICPYVTPKLAAIIGVQRAIKGIESCGRPVPKNFKCGSVTTPP